MKKTPIAVILFTFYVLIESSASYWMMFFMVLLYIIEYLWARLRKRQSTELNALLASYMDDNTLELKNLRKTTEIFSQRADRLAELTKEVAGLTKDLREKE